MTDASAARRRPAVGIGPSVFGFGGVASLISERHVSYERFRFRVDRTKAMAVFAAFGKSFCPVLLISRGLSYTCG